MQETKKIYTVPCKINLNLHIVGRKENGYHELDSIMLPIPSLYDTIIIHDKDDVTDLQVLCTTQGIDLQNNTLTKAYESFKKHTKFQKNIYIELKKGIPHGAGLGGGSADAAFVIKYLYSLWRNIDCTQDFLNNFMQYLQENDANFIERAREIALSIGADVPFFLYNRPMRAEGIGEKLSLIDTKEALENTYCLLVCPKIGVNTIQAYQDFRVKNPSTEKKIKKNDSESLTSVMKQAINPLNETVQAFFRNDLEESVFDVFPLIEKYKKQLLAYKAKVALMSGSGSSVFAIFDTKEDRAKAQLFFEKQEEVQLVHAVLL